MSEYLFLSQLLGELSRSGGVVGGDPSRRVRTRGPRIARGRHQSCLHCTGPRYRIREFKVFTKVVNYYLASI